MLLNAGFPTDDLDDVGNDALLLACAAGNYDVLRAVTGCGCNPAAVNKFGNSVMDLARDAKCRELMAIVAPQRYCSSTGTCE
jgi:hypothetical protein